MMPKSMVPFWVLGQRAAKPCLSSSILVSSPKIPFAISFATSMSKPTSSPLSSIKPKGGASLVTPTVTLPRERTSSRLDLPAATVEAVHGPLDGDVEPSDDVLDLRLGDDQRRREAEVVLHGNADDAFERAVIADALGHDRIGDLTLRILDDVEHAVEALAAHVADAG